MKTKMVLQTAALLLLSAGVAHAGGSKFGKQQKNWTCDDCTPACLQNPYDKGCPDICKSPACQNSCESCPASCKQQPGAPGCPEICSDIKCQSCSDCAPECKTSNAPATCPDICKDIKCYSCNDCSAECIANPAGPNCPPASICGDLECNICDKLPKNCPAACKDNPDDPAKCPAECKGVPEKCLLPPPVTQEEEKPETKVDLGPFRFLGDVGYYKQTDPADYVFGRIGAEWSPFAAGSRFEQISFTGMIGAAAQVKGDDGDDALLLDVMANYNWQAGDVNGWVGLGLGGWITSGVVDDDSGDSDLDMIVNAGARVYGDPQAFNVSAFLEIRSAVDEFDGLAEYGRFGGGLRFKF